MTAEETVSAIVAAPTWEARVALIRKIPETYGTAHHQAIFAAIASAVYVPNLAPDFAYVHWRDEYELARVEDAYHAAHAATNGFSSVGVDDLTRAIRETPSALVIFRLLLGLTIPEFAASSALVSDTGKPVGEGALKTMESGGSASQAAAHLCALVVDRAMRSELFAEPSSPDLRGKIRKPDTVEGWASVRAYANTGVPLPVFLHQRLYGGSFRQLLDATSTKRGDILEAPVEELFRSRGVPFLRTGSHNQNEIASRFGLTVKPAPDFVVFSHDGTLRALLECKGANDGGTARDKASRFGKLQAEATRLGGIPLFAVLGGLGWKRTTDALGPVIKHTDGRTFTLVTLDGILTVQPFPDLIA